MKFERVFSVLGLVTIAAAQSAYAVPEKDYFKTFDTVVMPFYNSAGVTGEFAGADGVKISYRKFQVANEKGAIVFAPGLGESYLTYPELEYDLTQAGYSIYVIDHRSQGFSGRTVENTQIVTVKKFDYYVADLSTFIDTVVQTTPHQHLYLLTNSMGGMIGAAYLAGHPKTFERAALSVPMFEIKLPVSEDTALGFVQQQINAGHGDDYTLGQKPYDFDHPRDCTVTNGYQLRRCKIEELVRANRYAASGGVSNNWMRESILATRTARNGLGKTIETPVIVLQAGKDQIVNLGGQNTFCDQTPGCKIVPFAESTHGLLSERDELRSPAIQTILGFFK